MRSFNYLHARFAHGDDFVCDAPDAVASSVELLLAELPPARASVDHGAVPLEEGLGTLVFVRRTSPARARPASPLGARRDQPQREFVHALVLAGRHPPARVQAAARLLLERYGPDPAEAIATLCRRLRDVEMVQAARLVSGLFVDPEAVRELCQDDLPPPRHRLFGARRHGPSWRDIKTTARSQLARAVRGVTRPFARLGTILSRSRKRSARVARGATRRLGSRIVGSANELRNQAGRVARGPKVLVASAGRGLVRMRGIPSRSVSAAAFMLGTFLLGYALALPSVEPPAAPPPPPVRVAALPPVSCGPPEAPPPSLDTGTVSLAADLAAAISRLEALELRAGVPETPAPAPPVALAPPAPPETPAVASPPPKPRAPARIAALPPPSQHRSRVVADVLVVRAGPGTAYNPVARLDHGTPVRAASQQRDGWTRIAEPVGGWVASRYLSK